MYINRNNITFAFIIALVSPFLNPNYSQAQSAIRISQDLLYAVKTDAETEELINQLSEIKTENLLEQLSDADARKAFWLNVYNAVVILRVKENPGLLEKSKARFFGKTAVVIAGKKLSLNRIEHGLIRKSKPLIGLGYLTNPFAGSFERKFRLDSCDKRIHFALNCGAKSCPPIAFYKAESIDEQLQLATQNYLCQHSHVNANSKELQLPRLLKWYTGDFGNKKKKIKFFQEYCPADDIATDWKIKYLSYDWTLALGQFVDY